MPSFEHSCFISYRHGQERIKRRFVDEFHRGLTAEMELLRNQKVYIDRQRLAGGDFFNDALELAVYQSAVMIVIYQPNYFDLQHPYCAREYRGMRALETERLRTLPNAVERNHGLIVPVVLRGTDKIPEELLSLRHYEDFSRFTLSDEDLGRHPEYAAKIRGIAEYIDARCKCLESAPVQFDSPATFRFPNEDETCEWIRGLELRGAQFPGAGRI